MNDTAGHAAAKWWSDAIETPKFDNGDNSQTGATTMMLAQLSVKEHAPEALGRFASILGQAIGAKLEDADTVIISVDYSPCRILYDAAEEARLKVSGLTTFPWKTHMWVKKDIVTVSHGYRAPVKTVWERDPVTDGNKEAHDD